ncbi:MAG: GDSL-type esterase/lipase family protein [candidate division Zixibacteria bacterium]|nr:GDSL-type esterase/lipase family protein [candidate division Zixibacteria bacterium]
MSKTWKIILVLSLVLNLSIVFVAYKAVQYRRYLNYWLDRYTQVVDEFSGRKVYAAENTLLESDEPVEERVVFLGTQVTTNWDLEAYFDDWEVVNRGVDSQRVSGYLLRFMPDVVDLAPRAVVVEISSYNFRPQWTVREMQDYVVSMADVARAHGIEPIIGTVIPPRRKGASAGPAIMDSLAFFNDWVRANAETGRWRCADFNAALADEGGYLREELSADLIEPNEAGYKAMAEAVRAVLARLP